MQVASVLSDLTSLNVTEQDAAIALVSAKSSPKDAKPFRKEASTLQNASLGSSLSFQSSRMADPTLARAYNLTQLHKTVKRAYLSESDGIQSQDSSVIQLRNARNDVQKALKIFEVGAGASSSNSANIENEEHSNDEEELEAWS